MKRDDARNVFKAADILCDASSQLIMAIDAIDDDSEKRAFRKKYAELIASIEQDFVYDICVKYPEFALHKSRHLSAPQHSAIWARALDRSAIGRLFLALR